MKRGSGRINKEIRIERLKDRLANPEHTPAQVWRGMHWVKL